MYFLTINTGNLENVYEKLILDISQQVYDIQKKKMDNVSTAIALDFCLNFPDGGSEMVIQAGGQ